MLTVHKYEIDNSAFQQIDMPIYYTPLSVQYQGSRLCVWVLCDDTKPKLKRTFRVFGTGDNMDEARNAIYLGTVQSPSGLVWHVFYD